MIGTDPLVADTDGDGLNDGDEVDNGTDPLHCSSPFDGNKTLLQAAITTYIDCAVNCDDPSTAHGVAFGDINTWCTAGITDMRSLFSGKSTFNENIGGWDVSSVTTMRDMFYFASAFNHNIGGWDVSSVENMYRMFFQATAFNQDIGGWNVRSVTNTGYMFVRASAFNQNLCAWKDDILTGTSTINMFSSSGCTIKTDPTSAAVCQPCN